MYFFYDNAGTPVAFWYFPNNGGSRITGYYFTNQQGDVVRIEDPDGNVLASYSYNAWGRVYACYGSMETINPLRYRGYYCDDETGFYYLQNRYYDPGLSRFINADSYASTGQGFLGYNMFAYCGNDPVNNIDSNGNFDRQVDNNFAYSVGAGLIGYVGLWATVQTVWNKLLSFVSQSKAEEAVTSDKGQEPKAKTYYHVTTAENAAAIMASGKLYGSRAESEYVFAWGSYPTAQAIKNSGARVANSTPGGVIICFETNAAFERDTGIKDKVANLCLPLRSVLKGPISVQNVKIVGWYYHED